MNAAARLRFRLQDSGRPKDGAILSASQIEVETIFSVCFAFPLFASTAAGAVNPDNNRLLDAGWRARFDERIGNLRHHRLGQHAQLIHGR